ncbi:MAG TPA: M48 family metallopeptidase [Terriglobales bacterium]|nr:M48 family metallopeptidase [Terriglobales bacterium]
MMKFADNISNLPDTPEARRYNRIHRWLEFSDVVLGLAFLVVLLLTGWNTVLRDWAYHGALQNYTLSVFLYVFLLMLSAKVLGLGLDYYGLRLERRFKLSTQKTRAWVWDQVKEFLVGLAFATVIAELLYFTIRVSPQHWWLIAWALFMALFVLLAQIAPLVLFPIFYKFEPLENDDLKNRLVRLSERAGTKVRGIYKWHLSEKSNKANAALTGLGATRRIILADTLLDHYSADEIEAVLAHELGHHVHRHILKSILVQALVTLAGFWAANYVLHLSIEQWEMFDTLSDYSNLPLLVLVSTVLSLFLMPALNAYSRFNERQADRYAFESIRSVQPFISSMNKLAAQNLAERTPSRWVEWLFHSHPAISRRVAAAEAWRELRLVVRPQS